jgi:branched-chain amino acid transport system permease protein
MVFGVMRLVNVAHGELLVLGAYLTLFASTALGTDPFIATLLSGAVLFFVGYLLQLFVFNPVMERGVEPALLSALGCPFAKPVLFIGRRTPVDHFYTQKPE